MRSVSSLIPNLAFVAQKSGTAPKSHKITGWQFLADKFRCFIHKCVVNFRTVSTPPVSLSYSRLNRRYTSEGHYEHSDWSTKRTGNIRRFKPYWIEVWIENLKATLYSFVCSTTYDYTDCISSFKRCELLMRFGKVVGLFNLFNFKPFIKGLAMTACSAYVNISLVHWSVQQLVSPLL